MAATTVTLSGSGLLEAQSVSFGGVAAVSISVVDDATIRVVTPPSAAGEVSVVATTPSGTTTAVQRFTYVPTVLPPPAFTPLTPARLLETRAAAGMLGYAGAKPVAGQVVQLQVTGRGGIPASGAGAVALNITATEAAGAGYVTVWPCGAAPPGTSTLNLQQAGSTVANLAVVGLGTGGTVCLWASAGTHLMADVTAWAAA